MVSGFLPKRIKGASVIFPKQITPNVSMNEGEQVADRRAVPGIQSG